MGNLSAFDIIESANVLPEVLLIAFFYESVLDKKYSGKLLYIAAYSFSFAVLAGVSVFVSAPYIQLGVTLALLLLIVMALYGGAVSKRLFAAVYYMLIVFISETLFAAVLSAVKYGEPSELLGSNMGRVLGMIGTKIFDFWLIVYSIRVYRRKVKSLPLKYWFLILLMPFQSALILAQTFTITQYGSAMLIGYIVSACGILYLNFSVFNYFESYDSQIRLAAMEQILERESENYRMLADSYSEIRSIRHDFRNQVLVLSGLIKAERYDEAQRYMTQMHETADSIFMVCYTGNSAVDSIINVKSSRAASQGIRFNSKINVRKIEFDTVGLCRILGNVLDNSIEACERLDDDREKQIFVSMTQKADRLIIEVSNTSLPVDVNNLTTSKKDNTAHGIGMQSIRRTAESMNGCVSCCYDNGIFSIQIVLDK